MGNWLNREIFILYLKQIKDHFQRGASVLEVQAVSLESTEVFFPWRFLQNSESTLRLREVNEAIHHEQN